MIVTIIEQFTTSYPSDHEQLPKIIWKPGLTIVSDHMETML